MGRCSNCHYGDIDFDLASDEGKEKYACQKDINNIVEIKEEDWEKDNNCEHSEKMFMEFPIKIDKIEESKDKSIIESSKYKIGERLYVTPTDSKYNNKKYEGFFLGEVSNTVYVGHDEEQNILKVGFWMYSPAVLVPELEEIFYNYNSDFSKKEFDDDVLEMISDYKKLSKEKQLVLKKLIDLLVD